MNGTQISGQLGWLGTALVAQRNNLSSLLARLRGIGLGGGTGIHHKFMNLLSQVAAEREKELSLIHEIEEMEKRHRELKQRNLLRQASLNIKNLDTVRELAISDDSFIKSRPRRYLLRRAPTEVAVAPFTSSMGAGQAYKTRSSGFWTFVGLWWLMSASPSNRKGQAPTVE